MLHISGYKKFFTLLLTLAGIIFAVPSFVGDNVLEKFPNWLKEKVSLGLDLQGGVHLLLEVDSSSAIYDQLFALSDDYRKILHKNEVKFTDFNVARGDKKENHTISFKINDIDKKNLVYKHLHQDGLGISSHNGMFIIKFSDKEIANRIKILIQQSREIVNKRINALGTKEPNVQTQGDNRIIVQLPGVEDPAEVKQILGKTAKLTFQIVHHRYPTLRDSGGVILPGTIALPEEGNPNNSYLIKKHVLLTGDNLLDAQAGFNYETNAPIVHIKFDTAGARKFGEITKRYTKHQLAMVLDGKVISAPTLQQVILGGKAEISGNFTAEETAKLAVLLRAGSLPAPIDIIEERTVGPDLGADSIAAGKNATLLSILLILVFMVVLYSLFGLFASFALVFNLLFLISALALTGSTLTLPGIAGIALTLGMAVDANVLIFERIKEEIRSGAKIMLAVDAGYKRAMATIMDSNITTLIGGLALFFFGSGPIKGFGVTLCLGIVISMFTAITLTRQIIVIWLNKFKPEILPI